MPSGVYGVSSSTFGGSAAGPSPVSFVTATDFQSKVLNATGPVAVEFMNFACIHCKKANPMVHDVAKALEGTVKVFQVNVPLEPALVKKYKIAGTPTFVMFQNGQEVGRSNPEITPFKRSTRWARRKPNCGSPTTVTFRFLQPPRTRAIGANIWSCSRRVTVRREGSSRGGSTRAAARSARTFRSRRCSARQNMRASFGPEIPGALRGTNGAT